MYTTCEATCMHTTRTCMDIIHIGMTWVGEYILKNVNEYIIHIHKHASNDKEPGFTSYTKARPIFTLARFNQYS